MPVAQALRSVFRHRHHATAAQLREKLRRFRDLVEHNDRVLELIADAGEKDGVISIATGLFQPIAADDVAAFVADAALAAPRNGTIEIAGPERAPFDEIIRNYLRMMGDDRPVHADPQARYFGGTVEQFSLVPTGEAQLGRIHLADWARKKLAA